jgi:type II secretory pathway pseudopilin PulG
MVNKKADIWVSTVLYILIGMAVIGMLLAVIRPKVAEMKDSLSIDQTVESLNKFDEIMLRTRQAIGTRLSYELSLSRGDLQINAQGENITWIIRDSAYRYSQEGVPIKLGNIEILTEKKGQFWQVTLTRDYSNSNLDLTFSGADTNKVLTASKMPYRIFLENQGLAENKQHIDITIE